MTTVEIILFAVGAFLLVVGYRRSDRNKMLAATLLLLFPVDADVKPTRGAEENLT